MPMIIFGAVGVHFTRRLPDSRKLRGIQVFSAVHGRKKLLIKISVSVYLAIRSKHQYSKHYRKCQIANQYRP